MTIRKLFGVALVAAVILAGGHLAVQTVTNLHQYSQQEAINRLIGAGPHEYTMQEGLNLLNTQPGTRDTLVTCFTWVFDDGLDELYDGGWIDTFTTYGWDATVAVLGRKSIEATLGEGVMDTVYMTASELQYLEAQGWDLVGHGYEPPGVTTDEANPNIWGRQSAAGHTDMSRGWATYADFYRDAARTYASFDTLGLSPPRGWRYTRSGAHNTFSRAVAAAGFDYGSTARGGATYLSSSYTYLTEVRRANGGPGTNNLGNYVSAYPNILPPRYNIPVVGGESQTLEEFKETVRDCVALKGSWHIWAGHRPSLWLSQSGVDISDAIAFVDSLENEGLLRVVTLTEGYDLFYNTPIGANANFIYPNFPDHNLDDTIDGMHRYRDAISFGFGQNLWGPDSLGTRDSVFTWSASMADTVNNYGVMGHGYAVLDYATGKKKAWDWNNTGKSHHAAEVTYVLPNFARGKTVRFEYWAQIDMDVVRATHTDYAAPGTADTNSVAFSSQMEQRWNAKDYSGDVAQDTWIVPYLRDTQRNNVRTGGGPHSSNFGSNTSPTNYNVFTARDTVGGNWQQVGASWYVPEGDDYLLITITKDSRFPAGAVRISNVSLTIDDRHPSRW